MESKAPAEAQGPQSLEPAIQRQQQERSFFDRAEGEGRLHMHSVAHMLLCTHVHIYTMSTNNKN